MYESYSHQAMPSKNYRELLGTVILRFSLKSLFPILLETISE